MTQMNRADHVITLNDGGASSVVIICEHASHFIPPVYQGLGLSVADSHSHAAWDLGAMDVATRIANRLDAPLVASGVSRLVYDCNRPPDAPDAMPARSEVIDVPGNRALSADDRAARIATVYQPFHAALRGAIARVADPAIVTIHSFTPVYHGEARAVEIGVLHDRDSRLADEMLQTSKRHTASNVQRNAPYGPNDGVTHTLQEHALPFGHPNVMLEIRSDLIATDDQKSAMADMLADWIMDACGSLSIKEDAQCQP